MDWNRSYLSGRISSLLVEYRTGLADTRIAAANTGAAHTI
jgi:hypothetical protein